MYRHQFQFYYVYSLYQENLTNTMVNFIVDKIINLQIVWSLYCGNKERHCKARTGFKGHMGLTQLALVFYDRLVSDTLQF